LDERDYWSAMLQKYDRQAIYYNAMTVV